MRQTEVTLSPRTFSRLADPSVTGPCPFSAELNFTHCRHMSCTYRLHFMVTWNCMQFTQRIILKALYCAAGAATFWQVLPKLSCKWSSFLSIYIWNFGAKPRCCLIPPPCQLFWFGVSPSLPLPLLKGRCQAWKVMFPNKKIPFHLGLQMVWVKQQFAVCCFETSCYQIPLLQKFSKASNSEIPWDKIYEVLYAHYIVANSY